MNKFQLLVFSLIILAISCKNRICNCELDQLTIKQNDIIIDSFFQKHTEDYATYWQKINEPNLTKIEIESYRFSITVLLYDYQKIYRIDRKANEAILYVKEYAVPTTTEFRKDSLVRDTMRVLTESEWINFKKTIDENCFWTIPVKEDRSILDGSSEMLEGYIPAGNSCTKSNYHVIFRASPDSSRFTNISYIIMDLDSFKLKQF